MFFCLKTIFLCLLNVSWITSIPQIFSESIHSFCKLDIHGKKITFPDKLWTASNKENTLYFSFCQSPQHLCHNQSSTCLLHKSSNEKTFFGDFTPHEFEESTLVASSTSQCPADPLKPLTLKVTLQCSDTTRPKPKIVPSEDEDECVFEVTMLKPGCRPKCTEIIDGVHMLDIRNFEKNIVVSWESKNFSLSPCGWNRICKNDISACEVINEKVVPLANLESQYLNYDVNKNMLTARGSFKEEGEKVKRDVEILIKCKWDTERGVALYKKPPKQGRHYKFQIESSYGCIKLPQKCTLSISNLNFDLSKLNNNDGWQVLGVPEGTITLNICGSLNNPPGVCSDQFSQVCHHNPTNGSYINRGSVLASLKQANDDVIEAIFVSGSTCTEKPEDSYSTRVAFKCSETERGPVFQEMKDCVLSLMWETPHACPRDYYTGEDCHVNDRISNRHLQGVTSPIDRNLTLTEDGQSLLFYNLCAPLHRSCANFTNASFCLKRNNEESVIAWDARQMISDNGQIRQQLQGRTCHNGQKSSVNVIYVCTYENPAPQPRLSVIEDGCVFNLTVYTSLACATQTSFRKCVYRVDNNTKYDLSNLTLKNDNHIVAANDGDFILNVCGPVVTRPGVLCRGDTMVCWHNKTEINIKNKFVSLGGVGEPRMRNDTLILEGIMGNLCHDSGSYEYYKSVIEFECSPQENGPMLVSKDKCVYNFKWATPEACPITENCNVEGSKPDTRINLVSLQTKNISINIDNNTNIYEFHFCSDTYSHRNNGNVTTNSLRRTYFEEDGPHLLFDLQKECVGLSTISRVFFKMECSRNEDYFVQKNYEKCVLNMTVGTHLACTESKDDLSVPEKIVEPTTTKYTDVPYAPKNIVEPTATKYTDFLTNCTVTNPYTSYIFNLSTLKGTKLRDNFITNFDKSVRGCDGLFCKNGVTVPSACPSVFFNYTNNVVNLKYATGLSCASKEYYEIDVILKCNQTKNGPTLIQDQSCSSTLQYHLPEACLLLKQDIIVAGSHTAAITGSVLSIIVIIVLVVIYLNRKKVRRFRDLPMFTSKERVPIYERNCSL